MEAVVIDAGSKLLKAGFAAPDQDPAMIIPTKMKCVLEEGDMDDSSAFEEVTVDPVVRGFIKDWDAMEDLLRHVLYTGLGWEMGEEGQILFTDPLSTPKKFEDSSCLQDSNSLMIVTSSITCQGFKPCYSHKGG